MKHRRNQRSLITGKFQRHPIAGASLHQLRGDRSSNEAIVSGRSLTGRLFIGWKVKSPTRADGNPGARLSIALQVPRLQKG